MQLPPGAHIAVIDGERFLLFRNGDDAQHPDIGSPSQPDLSPSNRSQGKLRPSITTSQDAGNDLDEAAHVAAAADWLNHAVLSNTIEKLVVVADKRSLGELRRHYHKELEERLVGEVAKALTGRPVPEIEQAMMDA